MVTVDLLLAAIYSPVLSSWIFGSNLSLWMAELDYARTMNRMSVMTFFGYLIIFANFSFSQKSLPLECGNPEIWSATLVHVCCVRIVLKSLSIGVRTTF